MWGIVIYKDQATNMEGVMPLHTTDDPGIRATHVARREEMEIWRRTGNARLANEVGIHSYDEALRLFSEGVFARSRHHLLCCCHECGGAG